MTAGRRFLLTIALVLFAGPVIAAQGVDITPQFVNVRCSVPRPSWRWCRPRSSGCCRGIDGRTTFARGWRSGSVTLGRCSLSRRESSSRRRRDGARRPRVESRRRSDQRAHLAGWHCTARAQRGVDSRSGQMAATDLGGQHRGHRRDAGRHHLRRLRRAHDVGVAGRSDLPSIRAFGFFGWRGASGSSVRSRSGARCSRCRCRRRWPKA